MMDFLVGTFNTPHIYTLRFTPANSTNASTLQLLARTKAIGSHSWLSLSSTKSHLYATAWTDPPSVAAYRLDRTSNNDYFIPSLLNTVPTASRSGYVCCSTRHVYSAGGPSGEVFTITKDGSLGDLVENISFVSQEATQSGGKDGERPHGDFGGLRSGAHSADLSPDGSKLYVADIGRNCVWTYHVNDEGESTEGKKPHMRLAAKVTSPRPNDGPRHAWPHPNGRILYVLQEHSCMVDVFQIGHEASPLVHVHGVRIIPADREPGLYWADEVRVSTSSPPQYLYASTRGLHDETKGYVAVFRLTDEGLIDGEALQIWETPTSGGWANAIEPCPISGGGLAKTEWLALTDSTEGLVFVLGFDGVKIWEESRVKLTAEQQGTIPGTATAVWL